MPFRIWACEGANVWETLGFQTLVFCLYTVTYAAASANRDQEFSLQLLCLFVAKNVPHVVVVIICLSAGSIIPWWMRPFAPLLWGSVIALLLWRHGAGMSGMLVRRESKWKLEHMALLRRLYASKPGTIRFEVCNPGPNERVEWVTGATKALLGYSHAQWKAMSPFDIIFTGNSKALAIQVIKAISEGEPVPVMELEATHCDGHTVWLGVDKLSHRLPDGSIFLAFYDANADREAKATMAALQQLPGFILVTTDMESHLGVDGDVLGVTGYTANEFLALDPTGDFLSPNADRAQVTASYESVVARAQPLLEVDTPYIHKDGRTIWLRLCHGSRVVGTAPSGKAKVLAVLRDVTSEVVAVRSERARSVELFPDMIYKMVVDEATGRRHFAHSSPQALSMCGLTAAEMTSSSTWTDMLHPSDAESFESSIAESQASMEEWELEFRVVVEGETKYLHGRAMPRREGAKVVWDGVLQDVTLLHNLREMTKQRDIEADNAQRFKAAVAYLSHEIRNQLYPQSVVLEDMKDEGFGLGKISMILDFNSTVTTILDRVLGMAKWESGNIQIDTKPFPISRLFGTVASYAQAKGATVEALAPVEPTWHVTADEHLLKQAATNLVSNAAKFSDGQPVHVAVAFEQMNGKDGVLVVTVTDKGRGMTPEQLSKAMLPFGQIRKAGEARSGTGLGLPLTKAMVEIGHRGTLTLTSEGLGKGTTAAIRVPVWWVAPHAGATADVLVVDDVKLNRMVTTRSAKNLGLTFHEAADGVEALELLRTNTYSIVFMDNQMPEMNGDVVTEQARANGYTLPIVMMSGDTFTPCEEDALKRRGVTAFLHKMSVPGPRHAMKKLKMAKDELQNTFGVGRDDRPTPGHHSNKRARSLSDYVKYNETGSKKKQCSSHK